MGSSSPPTAEDAIALGDPVLLEDFVIRFDEETFVRAGRESNGAVAQRWSALVPRAGGCAFQGPSQVHTDA